MVTNLEERVQPSSALGRIGVWIGFTIIALAFILVLGLYASTVDSLIARYLKFDENYSHGFLIFGLVLWLFWRQRDEIMRVRPYPYLPAVVALVPMTLLWLVGYLTDIIIVQQMLLPALIFSGILLLGGRELARLSLFPMAYLYFAIPIWDYLIGALVKITVIVVTTALAYSRIPVFIEANYINLTSGTIYVADACSGIRYFVVGTAFAALYGHLFFRSWRRRIGLIAIGAFLGVLTNWVRVYSLVMIAHFTEMRSPLIREHELYGLGLFVIVLVALIFIVNRYADAGPSREPRPAGPRSSTRTAAAIGCLAVLAVGPVLGMHMARDPGQPRFRPLELPTTGREFDPAPFAHELVLPGETLVDRVARGYGDEQSGIRLTVYRFHQREARQDFLPYRTLFERRHWTELDSEDSTLEGATGSHPVKALKIVNRRDERRWLVWYWFEVGGLPTRNRYIAKLAEIPALLNGRQDAVVVTLMTPCVRDCAGAQDRLERFLDAHLESLRSGIANGRLGGVPHATSG